MSEFDERRIKHPKCCRLCKHSCEVHLELSDDYVIKSYCLLGLSREDAVYAEEMLDGDLGVIPECPDFPERFCKLMRIEDSYDILYSPRSMDVNDCCDKYEK